MSWARMAGYLGLMLVRGPSLLGQSPSPPELPRSTAGHLILQPQEPEEEKGRHWIWKNKLYPTDIKFTVKDAADRPIPGAAVEFRLPEHRPGAVFRPAGTPCDFDGVRIAPTSSDKVACVKTGADGIARIEGLRATKVSGGFPIEVKASFGHETVTTTITEKNQAPPFVVRHKTWIVAATCTAVAITVVMLRRSSPPTATIGSVTATGPVGP